MSDPISCYGSRQTLTSPSMSLSVNVLRLMTHSRFLSDTFHCAMVTSKTVMRHVSCYGSRQTPTSLSDDVSRLMRIARASFLSYTTHCPMVTLKTIIRNVSCYGSRHTPTSLSDNDLRLMRIARARFLSDATHCPMVTSKTVIRQVTGSESGSYSSGRFTSRTHPDRTAGAGHVGQHTVRTRSSRHRQTHWGARDLAVGAPAPTITGPLVDLLSVLQHEVPMDTTTVCKELYN